MRGIENLMKGITEVRLSDIPYLGICYGFQMAVIEYGRNILKLEDCNTTENKKDCKNPVVEEIKMVLNIAKNEDDIHYMIPNKLRIGSRKVLLKENSLAKKIYNSDQTHERYRHRYSFNLKYKD